MRKTLYSREYKALTRLLGETRRAVGLSQEQLASRLRKPQSFVAKYEGGERRLDVVEFIKIAKALGQEPDRLFGALLARIPG